MNIPTLFKRARVTLAFRHRVCGGVPKSPEVIKPWIRTKVSDESRVEQLIADTQAAMHCEALTEEQQEEIRGACWNGFKSDVKTGLYLEGRQVKASLKEAANIVKNKIDMSALKSRVAERFFVVEEKIPLGVTEPTGSYESMIHTFGKSGPINALKRVDYVEKPTIRFTVKYFDEPFAGKTKGHRLSPLDVLRVCLEMGSELGLGADRSQGNGQFDAIDISEVGA